jgi:hypothetical protein
MLNKLNLISALLLICFFLNKDLMAQDNSLKQSENNIKSLLSELMIAKSDSQRFEINTKIENLFGEVLKTAESFVYPFDSLKNISKLKSDDGLIRIINWNFQLENGNFVYYGYVQSIDKKKNLTLFQLTDKSDNMKNPENKELSEKEWYGALYYKLLSSRAGKKTYYTLLGWDGNDNFTNKKIVETFYITANKIVFGPPIFKLEKGIQNRVIFEFSEQAKMLLKYDEKLKMIVFDHLVPIQSKFEGQFMYYGPDMSQDGLKFEGGNWVFKPNLDLRNANEIKGKPINKSDKFTNF